MKVFDLQCANGHVFEGWFASHEDYDAQHARGLITCPVCDNAQVSKRLSAPRLNMGHTSEPAPRQADSSERDDTGTRSTDTRGTASAPSVQPRQPSQAQQLQAQLFQQIRQAVRQAENVGAAFAAEARRIHDGEASARPIRGQASRDEYQALAADGIMALPIPALFDDERLH